MISYIPPTQYHIINLHVCSLQVVTCNVNNMLSRHFPVYSICENSVNYLDVQQNLNITPHFFELHTEFGASRVCFSMIRGMQQVASDDLKNDALKIQAGAFLF